MPATPPGAAEAPQHAPPARVDSDTVVGVLGLGYVGLPLAIEFGKQFETRGFDIDAKRVAALSGAVDDTREVAPDQFAAASRLSFTADVEALRGCDVFVVAVPTPVDARNRPALGALEAASRMVGRVIAPGGVVVFESTVYPGATEEVCVPLVAAESGLVLNEHFFAGYSPERINPGDKSHGLRHVVKVTSGSSPEAARFVDALYAAIVDAGTCPVADIRTAEAAKVIENTQRDLNIALVNEFAMIFERLGLDTEAVLAAAGTKWNFLPFRPGLVGGHCLGVDPYYLTHKAAEAGHHPELILAGRRINDAMAQYVADRLARLMRGRGLAVDGARVLVLGLAFKENCPDVRNTKVLDLIASLSARRARVDVCDPWVAKGEVDAPPLVDEPPPGAYDAVVVAVAHDVFRRWGAKRIRGFGKPGAVLFDVKHLLPRGDVDGRL